MNPIKTRVVLHFPGFEPLDAALHRARFARAAAQTAAIWNVSLECGALQQGANINAFAVDAHGPNWATTTHYHVFDLAEHIDFLLKRPFLTVLFNGYSAFFQVVATGGTWNYLRHAWRFGLFSIFPFLFMALGLAFVACLGLLPIQFDTPKWLLAGTIPVAAILFKYAFMPLANRLHTMLLFSDWRCAVDFATLKDPRLNKRLAEMVTIAKAAFEQPADEYLIVSHSIGSHAAVHVIGRLLEDNSQCYNGKKVVYASVGSGLLQGAFLRPAKVLRRRVALIAANPQIFWFDVQCLTDISHFYKTKVAELCGYAGERQPSISFIRIKTMLTKERYARIKRDLLRVHRQYVLGNDVRANYDFALMCAGPLSASTFSALKIGELPPISNNGRLLAI
jgi:hypothetical protein